jgi:acyl transferase domain-containing protein
VVLALQHRAIPPTLHCDAPHPRFAFETSPFTPATRARPWAPLQGGRIACVSSFGFGGTNCHAIVQEFDDAAAGYTPSRASLSPTRFNRKRFWLSDENDRTAVELRALFERVAAGQVSSQTAIAQLKSR